MDQEPPFRRNTFVLVAVVLFNLIWIALLFLSCQADNDPNPAATPEAEIENLSHWISAAPLCLNATNPEKENQTVETVDCTSRGILHSNTLISEPVNYNVPLYNPPSTCSITPVI